MENQTQHVTLAIIAFVGKQIEAIQNPKIDKITVWDSGTKTSTGGSATSDFVSNRIKVLPPRHEIAGMAGIELPNYLGQLAPSPPSLKPGPQTNNASKA